MKGGSGKSTIATNLARGLQEHGSVLIIDADPQGTALRWSNATGEEQHTVVAINPPLDQRIRELSSGYDFVVVDGAARAKDRTLQAVKASDVVLIPVRPSAADLWASEWLVGIVRSRQRMTGGTPAAAFVISQQIVGTNLAGEMDEALNAYELPILEGRTAQRIAYAESLSLGSMVLDTAPSSKAAEEVQQITRDTLTLIQQAHGDSQ
jgi:chromosome partitioning protein